MQNFFQKIVQSIKKTKWIPIVISGFVLGIFLLFITLNNVYTKTYDIKRFNTAKETIRSPITIENEQETERKTREAVQSVKDRFDISKEITNQRIQFIEEIFEAINTIEKTEAKKKNDEASLTHQEKLQQLKQILSPEITEQINDSVFAYLLELDEKERNKGKKELTESVKQILSNGVRMENIERATSEAISSIKYTDLEEDFKKHLQKLAEFSIVENSFFDYDKTMEAQKSAASNVDPVVIRAGEIIVREGQTITNEIYEELKLVGLLNKERNFYPVISLLIFIAMILSIITYELFVLDKKQGIDRGIILSVLFISILVISLMKVISLYTTTTNQLFYTVPVATGVLLVKLLINERLAIVLASLYAILGTIIFNGEIPGSLNMEAGIYFFFSQMAAIIFLVNVKDRLTIMKSGIGMSIVNIVTVLLFLFLSFEKYSIKDLFLQSGFGVLSAFLSAVLAIGLLPFFETSLGILSDIKLLQLSSPNHPLLKKLLTEAPGTYHHSVMVANLSETACEAIGVNGLLARVGAYYHDIGKTVRPHYFIENQLAIRNPHDFIEPRQSAQIIMAHPYDGVEMLKKHKMPKEIIAIAQQHHGTTLLKYFYYKEKETDEHVTESEFRYPGPKPQTKETAIVSICDSVEAATRSLKEPTKEKIEEVVSSIIKDRLTDGQFDECALTFMELKIAQQTICDTLKGIFHSRIQYPEKEEV
ncbi:HD family phosphohydrolase [Cerasibacillus terrae]|uniref:HD family phosphohydrolase n=1 Tax=Cerasibacillus terrae TaxID=2498845 RepID=A0A5C8P3H7_9BACI|nr:HD family phosphohydrolase [Cerasibacillus terrae]TXL68008.1 HD family phosphohydrolase [Cerasibacillus terrae]